MHGVYQRDSHSLHMRLTAIRMMATYYLPPAEGMLRRSVDVSGIITNIRCATRYFEGFIVPSGTSKEMPDPELEKSYRPLLCFELMNAHMSSYTNTCDTESSFGSPVFSSLSGLAAAMQLYLAAILGMINVGWKPFRALATYTASIITRDLRDSAGDLEGWDTDRRDLWLWKAVSGFTGLAVVHGHDEAMKSPFGSWILLWCEHTGLRDWSGAREALDRVAWPRTVARGLDMENLWQDIMAV